MPRYSSARTCSNTCALIAAWIAIGQGALSGRIDFGWLAAWACLLATMIPLRALTTWSQGMLAIGAGGLLKQRLLAGALTLDPDVMRKEGAGELLGRVNEGEQLEALALSGGLLSLLAVFELAVTAFIIAGGPSASLQLPAFLIWICICSALAIRYISRRRVLGARPAHHDPSSRRKHDGPSDAPRAAARRDLAQRRG